jgi:diketogulonate reductase-like aldo/keto reductase
MTDVPTRTLPGGTEMPLVGFGTGPLKGDAVEPALRAALEAGYRHVDTAEGYRNEREIGAVLADADVARSDLFLASKVLPSNLHYESVLAACEASLDRLGTDYLDLYLVHWPNPAVSLRETMAAMARLRERGLVREVGVSNFDAYSLRFARRVSDAPVAVNQFESHPYRPQATLRRACEEAGVAPSAASPLARARVLDDAVVQEVAAARDRSPAQVVLRWQVQRGVAVVPTSASRDHVRTNLSLFDFSLREDELDRIDELDRDERVYDLNLDDDLFGVPP